MAEVKKLYRIRRYNDGTRYGKKGMSDTGKTLVSLTEAKKRLMHDEDEIVVFTLENVITKKSLDREKSMNQIYDGFPNKRQSIAINLVDSTSWENLKNLITDEKILKKYIQSRRTEIFKKSTTLQDYVSILSIHSFNAVPYKWKFRNEESGRVSDYNHGNSWARGVRKKEKWIRFREYQGDKKIFDRAKDVLKEEKLKLERDVKEKITS